ncbi:uncharacterized protein LOC113284281 isoform X2 [Papaver somniferum]|uniref:uncharacterized protein LOC113284281 isoform X2 n=1 Tax=Papaver somniferum TaxID=3469 RepID=UPI000E7053F7|nr:uncharacterized protein LOC113284281 isoform X2 [Papaver somniferum]
MDYDDNDFQNQTFQLVSEEKNSKFPPGLSSYSLPKFDLDDNVNLRFDSLVGSEGLLGIRSQEENQWIEDFSGGSSGIEFSSTAAESCSISRRNNVWSEATSSESVEMLLKSVGQDEMIMEQNTTIIKGSVSGDGLGDLTTQMGLQNSDKDGSVAPPSKGLDAMDEDSALPTNLSKEAPDQLLPQVEPTDGITDDGDASVYGSLKDLGPSSVIETYCSASVTESGRDLFVDDDKCRKANMEVVPLVSSEGKNKTPHACPPGFENMHLGPSAAPDPTHAKNVSGVSVSNCCDSLTANKKNEMGQDDVSFLSDSSRLLVVSSSEAAETTKIGGLESSDSVIVHSDAPLINKEIERSTIDPGSKVECDADGSLIVGEKVCTSSSSQTIITESMVHETPSVQVLSEQSDLMKLGCNNKLSGAKDLPDGSNIGVKPEEDVKTQLLVEKFKHSDKQEAVTTICLEPSSSSVMNVRSEMPDMSISSELREGEASVDAGKIVDAIGEPSSPLGHDSARCQNKPPTTVANKDALDSRDVLGTPVSYESLSEENDGVQAVVGVSSVVQEGAVMESAGSYGEILKKPIPSLEESSHDVDPKTVEEPKESGNDVQSVLVGEKGDALNDSGDFSKSLMLRDDADRQSLQTGSSNPNSIELRCGSPTVVSCSEISQNEKEDPLLGDASNVSIESVRILNGDSELQPVQTGNSNLNSIESNCGSPTVISCSEPSLSEKENLVLGKDVLADQSNASVCEANIATSVLLDPNVKSCSQDDRNFTFEVGSQPHPSERTGDDWRPFPTDLPGASQGSPPRETSSQIDSKMLSHVSQGSASTKTVSQVNPKMSSHTSQGSPRKSGGRKVRKSSKGHKPADDTTTAGSDKTAGTEASNDKGSPLKNELLLCQKECQEGQGGIAQGANQFSSIFHDPRKVDLLRDDRSFTFKVTSHEHLAETEIGSGWKPFPSLQPNDVLQTVGTSPIISSFSQTDPNIIQDISFANTRTPGVKSERRRSRVADGKARSGSGKVVDRVAAKEGKTLEEVTPRKQIKGRGGSSSGTLSPSSFGIVNHVAPAEEMRPFGFIDGSNTKPSPVLMGHTSSLPDLNTSIPTSALFQQPFTDSQQVQLRAQIFVYGSLIQGTTPDEPCMISAFGESDGGRSMWENAWRIALERLQHQKSPLSSAKAPAQSTRSFLQNDAFSTPGRPGGVGASPSMISPVIPMSSPLWNVSSPCEGLYASSSSTMKGGPLMDPHQTLVQVHHPYQSPHLRHYVGSTNTWQPQAPTPATWVVSTPQSSSLSAPNAIHSAALPISEAVHVPSGREPSSASRPSGLVQQPALPPSTSASTTSPIVDVKRTPPPSGKQAAAESKPRKRRKGSASLEIDQISTFVQPTSAPEPISSHGDGHQLPTTSITPITSVPSDFDPNVSADSNFVLATTSLTPPKPNVLVGHADTEQRSGTVLSEETCRQIDQAQQQAEEASALATAAVNHSQSVWAQLAIQKSSGLVSDLEAKLASAAVTIVAAAAVAKAAAAAAKIASDAALQAKLMADEVLVCQLGNMTSDACLHGGVKNMGNFFSPASILKSKDRTNNSDSILVVAREAAKKRVEAASAATRRAENLDAVVKAAGMAAEAVSQASTIIAMGDPVPFTLQELVEAGPENYWKAQQHHLFSDQTAKLNSNTTNMVQQAEVVCAEEGVTRCIENNLKEMEGTSDQGKKVPPPKELSKQVKNNNLMVNGIRRGPAGNGEKSLTEPKPGRTSDVVETIGSAPVESICALQTARSEECEAAGESAPASIENQIEEGSVVEVLSCEEGLGRRVWLPSKVLNLKDGKAHVCFAELARAGGSGQSTEWVSLGGEGGQAPRIRIPHLVSASKYEGTRKRRRAARGDCSWSIGDKVDAWINNGWWEGTITEMGKDNEANLTIQLSAQGDASIVGSWNLRPSLFWRDGHWIEWSRSTENIVSSHEGDTPREKRTKFGPRAAETDAGIEVRETDKIGKHKVHIEESEKPEASRPLPLSAKETVFNIGKNSKEDNKDKFGMKQTGLQKLGSSVVPGVSKPGRKRKFMDVSKHYVPNRGVTTITEANDSIKFTKFLIPQDSASRGWKNPSKIVSRGKRVAESRPNFQKTGNLDTVTGRNTSERDSRSSSVSVPSATTEGVAHDIPNTPASSTKNEGYMLGSVSDAPLAKKKPSSTVAPTFANKRKLGAFPGQKLSRNEDKDRVGQNEKPVIPDAVEPRRSVRRIQPTSRLLEGLQSSLIASKIPTAHDRGTKGQHRGAARAVL